MPFDPANPDPFQNSPDASENHQSEPASLESKSNQPSEGLSDTELMYLHPSSLFFDLLAHGRTYLVPIVFGLFGAANGNTYFLLISGIFFIPAVGMSVFRYMTLRYRIEADHLIVNQGLVFRKTRTVPVSRIQNIDLVQSVLHRMLGVAEVKIETASGTEPEAVLRVLSMAQMEALRKAIFARTGRNDNDVGTASEFASCGEAVASSGNSLDAPFAEVGREQQPTALTSPRDTTQLVHSISSTQLMMAGLASNRGLIMLSILIGSYFQLVDDNAQKSIFDFFDQWFPKVESIVWFVGLIIASVIVGLICLRLLGIGWYLLRFFGYRLERRGDDLRISCGLFTKVSATVPRKRIQLISIHRSLIMRWLGLASIRVETAGGSGELQNATESVSKRWFVPVISESQVNELIGMLRPGLSWDESALDFKPVAELALTRLRRISVVVSVALIVIGLIASRPFGFLPGLVAFPLLWWWATKKARSMRYARTEQGVVYRSGILNQKISITFFEKIQTLSIYQSPFDRRWKMARLIVDTAAAGPAGHFIAVPYLDESFVQQEFQTLREMTGENQPVFG